MHARLCGMKRKKVASGMHLRRRVHAYSGKEREGGVTGGEGVNVRAAGHPGSENPEKYVIVSSTVITKNRTNERTQERAAECDACWRTYVLFRPPPPLLPPVRRFCATLFSLARVDTNPSLPFPALVFFFPPSRNLHLRISAADAVIVRCSSRCIVGRNNDFIKIHARKRR